MKVGQRFIVTTGEYSDYSIRDSFIVLKTFSFDKALRRWIEKNESDEFDYGEGKSERDFLASLRTSGCVVDDELTEVHLSDSSRPCTDPAGDDADEQGVHEGEQANGL